VPELAERFGLGDEATLREQIKLALEQRRDLEQRAAMREQVYEHLLAAVDFPVPEQLNAAQLTRLIERQRIELLYRGIEPEQVETQLAAMRAGTEAQSRTRLKLFFILSSFAEQLGVQVTEQEVNGRVAAMARQRGQRPEVLRTEMANAGLLNEVALQIREHKTADRLLERCTIADMPADKWNETVLERQRAATGKSAAPKSEGGEKSATGKKS
jgi:trigger factor